MKPCCRMLYMGMMRLGSPLNLNFFRDSIALSLFGPKNTQCEPFGCTFWNLTGSNIRFYFSEYHDEVVKFGVSSTANSRTIFSNIRSLVAFESILLFILIDSLPSRFLRACLATITLIKSASISLFSQPY